MNAVLGELSESRRRFFSFLAKRAAMGTAISVVFTALFLFADIGGIASLMMRSNDSWMWVAFFWFDFWVTVTGITIAIGLWRLGDWRDPPADE